MRFYSEGRDVLDSDRPDRYCGFVYADSAANMALRFNTDPVEASYYSWQYIDGDEYIDDDYGVDYDDDFDIDDIDYIEIVESGDDDAFTNEEFKGVGTNV